MSADVEYPPFVRRQELRLTPDPSNVVLRPFRPAVEPRDKNPLAPNRVERIIESVLALSDPERAAVWKEILKGFADRHIDVQSFFLKTFRQVAEPYCDDVLLTIDEQLLIGAYFSHEYSFQAAALFNPSIVPHPEEAGDEARLRVILSLRAVGEGHISSICFRTGWIEEDGTLSLEEHHQHSMIAAAELEGGGDTATLRIAEGNPLDAAVLFPVTAAQSNGIEDLRLVAFTREDGSRTYYGTYTAYSGSAIRSEMLATDGFTEIEMRPLTGSASKNKGMALFPRQLDGRYMMVGRQDNENLWLLQSDDVWSWSGGEIMLRPRYPWELIQMGNCGSPIEIDEDWIVLTHGVGPVRNYSIGACLVDKRDPSRVLARTPEPLLRAHGEEREGYVPNVVYTCGALLHGQQLVIPYAIADNITTAASIEIPALLAAME